MEKNSKRTATVGVFLTVLFSKLTRYDQKLEVKQPNIYRLSHYLGAVEKVRADVAGLEQLSSPDALQKLKASLGTRFTSDFGGVPDLSPVRNVYKQIDAFLDTGKFPKLI